MSKLRDYSKPPPVLKGSKYELLHHVDDISLVLILLYWLTLSFRAHDESKKNTGTRGVWLMNRQTIDDGSKIKTGTPGVWPTIAVADQT